MWPFNKSNKTTEKEESSPSPRYADLFEMMRYDRAADVTPYAIGFRLKSPLVDPTGPEPKFALLDTEAEVEAFVKVFNGLVTFESTGAVSIEPLLRWNNTPSALMADVPVYEITYPDDETKGWPYLQVCAVPPVMFEAGQIKPEDLVRGRYGFEPFPPKDKKKHVKRFLKARENAVGPDIFFNGKVPISLAAILNPSAGKKAN